MSKLVVLNYDGEMPEQSFDGKYRKIDVSLIKYITHRVRNTIEYRTIIQYMKRNMNINRCSFYKDYTMERGFTIELHHSPLTVFDIVETICNKFFSMREKDPYIEPWRIEEEVNKLHYRFEVGLVPLNATAHQLVHNGNLNIHPSMVEGNWQRFVIDHNEWMSDEAKGKIDAFKTFGKTDPNKVPEIIKYKPAIIINSNYKLLGKMNVEKMIIDNLTKRFKKTQKKIMN